MTNTVGMAVVDSLDDLSKDLASFLLLKVLVVDDSVEKFSSLTNSKLRIPILKNQVDAF